jgi:hypothetical protein
MAETVQMYMHQDGAWCFIVVQLAVGSWQLAVGSWQLAVGSWQLAVGSWQLAVGSWQLAVGSWQLAVGKIVNSIFVFTANCQLTTANFL